jgi:hypothetical protein
MKEEKKKIAQACFILKHYNVEPAKIVAFSLISPFLQESQWLIGEEESLLYLRNPAFSKREMFSKNPLPFLNRRSKTLIAPKEYGASIAQGLGQECVCLFWEGSSVYCAREGALPYAPHVPISIEKGSLPMILDTLKQHFDSLQGFYLYLDFNFLMDPSEWIEEEILFLQTETLAEIFFPSKTEESVPFYSVWDHWYA